MRVGYVLLFWAIMASASVQAQGCIDSLGVSIGYICPDPSYMPVCGCDNKTYRNACEAELRYGVRQWMDGPCSGFEIDILSNYSATTLELTIFNAMSPQFIKAIVMDCYGKMLLQLNIPLEVRHQLKLDISTFTPGIYYLYVYDSKDNIRFLKFAKTDY